MELESQSLKQCIKQIELINIVDLDLDEVRKTLDTLNPHYEKLEVLISKATGRAFPESVFDPEEYIRSLHSNEKIVAALRFQVQLTSTIIARLKTFVKILISKAKDVEVEIRYENIQNNKGLSSIDIKSYVDFKNKAINSKKLEVDSHLILWESTNKKLLDLISDFRNQSKILESSKKLFEKYPPLLYIGKESEDLEKISGKDSQNKETSESDLNRVFTQIERN